MFFQNNIARSVDFERLLQFFHFLRPHQMIYQLTLVTIILFFSPAVSMFQLFSAFVMIILITPSFLLVQDVLGKKDDEKVGQKRILFSKRINKVFFYSSLTILVFILILNNVWALMSYILLFFFTLSYAVMKHYRRMVLSYTFRYLSSVWTFLLYLFILVVSINELFFALLIFISLLDLVGNIAGDIRDCKKDSLAGVKTLATTKGMTFTLLIMFFFVLLSFSILYFLISNYLFLLLLCINLIPFFILIKIPLQFSHGIFHLSKIFNFLSISFILSGISFIPFFFALTCIMCLWSISYFLYLYYPDNVNIHFIKVEFYI